MEEGPGSFRLSHVPETDGICRGVDGDDDDDDNDDYGPGNPPDRQAAR